MKLLALLLCLAGCSHVVEYTIEDPLPNHHGSRLCTTVDGLLTGCIELDCCKCQAAK